MIANASLVASVTLTITAVVVVYTDVRCPTCGKRIADVPAASRPVVRVRTTADDLRGGVAVRCQRCKGLVEIQHAA